MVTLYRNTPAENGFHTGRHLARTEGFHHIVVAADFKADHPVDFRLARGQEQHRHRRAGADCLQTSNPLRSGRPMSRITSANGPAASIASASRPVARHSGRSPPSSARRPVYQRWPARLRRSGFARAWRCRTDAGGSGIPRFYPIRRAASSRPAGWPMSRRRPAQRTPRKPRRARSCSIASVTCTSPP